MGQHAPEGRFVERCGISGVIGSQMKHFESRYVGQVGNGARWRKVRDEVRKRYPVLGQNRGSRRNRRNEDARHGAEEFVADQFAGHREGVRQRVDQRADHVVAVDGEALDRI